MNEHFFKIHSRFYNEWDLLIRYYLTSSLKILGDCWFPHRRWKKRWWSNLKVYVMPSHEVKCCCVEIRELRKCILTTHSSSCDVRILFSHKSSCNIESSVRWQRKFYSECEKFFHLIIFPSSLSLAGRCSRQEIHSSSLKIAFVHLRLAIFLM